MTALSPETAPIASRRVVLIDFDWHDADLLPELLRRPGLSVRLVAGERQDDIGLRVAEMCDLPRTVDLADVTREIFDVALVGERSPRRTQVESLLQALGTPCLSPQAYLSGSVDGLADGPAIEAPLALHAAAFESALGGAEVDAILANALPDVGDDAPTAPQPVAASGRVPAFQLRLEDFPSLKDRQALERALASLVEGTGATSAVLHVGRADDVHLVARVGEEDPLLQGLVELALELEAPQVVTRLSGPDEGKAWGAWPFRTTRTRGVLAAAAIDPANGWTTWERTLEELRTNWDERDRELAARAFPMVPEEPRGWIDVAAFRARLELAVERNRRDGLRFAVHRLSWQAPVEGLADLWSRVPDRLRDTDCLCRPEPATMLMLTRAVPGGFDPVLDRLAELWSRAWTAGGHEGLAPPIETAMTELTAPADAETFLARAHGWLTPR